MEESPSLVSWPLLIMANLKLNQKVKTRVQHSTSWSGLWSLLISWHQTGSWAHCTGSRIGMPSGSEQHLSFEYHFLQVLLYSNFVPEIFAFPMDQEKYKWNNISYIHFLYPHGSSDLAIPNQAIPPKQVLHQDIFPHRAVTKFLLPSCPQGCHPDNHIQCLHLLTVLSLIIKTRTLKSRWQWRWRREDSRSLSRELTSAHRCAWGQPVQGTKSPQNGSWALTLICIIIQQEQHNAALSLYHWPCPGELSRDTDTL